MSPVDDVRCLAPLVANLLVACSPCVLDYVVQSEPILWRAPLLSVPLGVSEMELLLFLFGLDEVLGHLFALEFGQVDVLLAVGEVGHLPLPLLLVPLRVVDNHIDLITGHEHVHDGGELLDLLLLVADGIEKLLLLILMLVLDVPQLCEIGDVFFLDLSKALLDFIHLFIEVLVVLLNAE